MITAVAFCPQPPLLVPEVAAGAAGELAGLRAACDAAVGDVLDTSPDRVVIIGGGPGGWAASAARGSMAGLGVDLTIPLDPSLPPGDERLPLPLALGAWLLARSGWTGARAAYAVGASDDGMQLADRTARGRTGLLVMADGSNSRTEKAPGALHPDAAAFDAGVAVALAAGDPDAALRAVDPARARSVGSQGAPAWRVAFELAAGRAWTGRLHYDEAPYGVGYLVASWN